MHAYFYKVYISRVLPFSLEWNFRFLSSTPVPSHSSFRIAQTIQFEEICLPDYDTFDLLFIIDGGSSPGFSLHILQGFTFSLSS